MQNDLEEPLRAIGERLKEAKLIEEDIFKTHCEKTKPLFVKCLKALQSKLKVGQTLPLDCTILDVDEDRLYYGITFLTSNHVIVQLLDVARGKIIPLDIKIYSTEEYVEKIDSPYTMQELFNTLLNFLKAADSKTNYCV
jgi:hypothetical protein